MAECDSSSSKRETAAAAERREKKPSAWIEWEGCEIMGSLTIDATKRFIVKDFGLLSSYLSPCFLSIVLRVVPNLDLQHS